MDKEEKKEQTLALCRLVKHAISPQRQRGPSRGVLGPTLFEKEGGKKSVPRSKNSLLRPTISSRRPGASTLVPNAAEATVPIT